MRLLLDTHIILWAMTDDARLPRFARELIEDDSNELYFSAISVAEISIKHQNHPEDMPFSGEDAREAFVRAGYREMPFEASYVLSLDKLPRYHRDPFDRMLLAQADSEGMKIVSHDNRFPAYGDFVISV